MRDNMKPQMKILNAKKSNSCFFCLKADPLFLLPACTGWMPSTHHAGK
jgi:hypothetical protein